MELDGVLADPELGRDLLVAQTSRHEREDVELALGQAIRVGRTACCLGAGRQALAATELIDDAGGRRRAIAASPRPTASSIDRSSAASRFLRRYPWAPP